MAGTLRLDTISNRDASKSVSVDDIASGLPKAWVNFNGTTGVIRNSHGVNSVTRNATGKYTISLAEPLLTADQGACVIGCVSNGDPHAKSSMQVDACLTDQQTAKVGIVGRTFADPYSDYVVLMVHGNGTHGSTFIPDSSSRTAIPSIAGNAAISTTDSKYDGSSMYFDGAAAHVKFPGITAYSFNLNDFTIECWINSTDTNCMFVDYWQSSPTSWQMGMSADGFLSWCGNSSYIKTGAIPINDGIWHHVAVTRQAGIINMWIDGVKDGDGAADVTDYSTMQSFLSFGGQVNSYAAEYDYAGYMSDVRITNGVCRYTTTFTPPTGTMPDSVPGFIDPTVVNVVVYQ